MCVTTGQRILAQLWLLRRLLVAFARDPFDPGLAESAADIGLSLPRHPNGAHRGDWSAGPIGRSARQAGQLAVSPNPTLLSVESA
jgi:hypothetical protein